MAQDRTECTTAWHRRMGAARWVLAALFLASVAVPVTREIQLLLVRLLFNLNGDTVVQGQLPGCVIYPIPNIRFSDEMSERIQAEAASDPDAYLIAQTYAVGSWDPSCVPPAERWTGHSLTPYAAITAAAALAIRLGAGSREENDLLKCRTQAMRELVRRAQFDHPDNGAPWLAEAALDFTQANEAAALSALRVAASKPTWDAQSKVSRERQCVLLEHRGFPHLEALTSVTSGVPPTLYLVSSIRNHLAKTIATTIRTGDREHFSILMELLRTLMGVSWRDPRCQRDIFSDILDDDEEIGEAMADRLKIEGPIQPGRRNLTDDERETLLRDYLTLQLGLQGASKLLEARKTEKTRAQRFVGTDAETGFQETFRWNYMYWRDAVSISLMFLVWLLMDVLMDTSFLLIGKRTSDTHRFPRQPAFGCAAAGAFAGGVWLWTSALDAVAQPVGLRMGPGPALSPHAEHLLLAAGVCTVWMAVKLIFYRWIKRPTRPLRISLIIVGSCYMLSLAVAGTVRTHTAAVVTRYIDY